ncbi:PAS domain-containing protein [Haloarcula sp. S1AR25-5A]|uniref:histidine kinase n=1 Tax=Haloarcula terrestris TaxID=2950533 RepID=A0AAE4EXF6_9EURY|nr:PAS domain-containing protein [Haloarcula terrestris]MDS0221294.1 PAS domain-containing protein [Haloarcula terrestris]
MIDMYGTADSRHILQVDDTPLLDETVEFPDARETDSLTVTTTGRADDALDILDTNAVDGIVVADHLPDMAGLAFVDAVRERYSAVPILLLTESESVASDAVSRGVTDIFSKGAHAGDSDLLANRIRLLVERHKSAETAARARQRLTELTEQSDELLWVFSGDWTEIQFVNSRYESLYGRSVESLQANPAEFMTAIHPDDQDRVIQAMQRVSAGESVELEFRITRPDDEERWVRAEAQPVVEDGTVARIVGASRDITERKRRESPLDSEPVPLQTVVEQCWQTVASGDATLELQTSAVVRADPRRLRQLFETLIWNTVEHRSTSSRTGADDSVDRGSTSHTERQNDAGEQRSTTSLSQSQGAAAGLTITVGELDDGFYVADDGVGVPAEERDSVFEGSHSLASEPEPGLRIVDEIADTHGWSITGTKSDDGGARFEITGVEFETA